MIVFIKIKITHSFLCRKCAYMNGTHMISLTFFGKGKTYEVKSLTVLNVFYFVFIFCPLFDFFIYLVIK